MPSERVLGQVRAVCLCRDWHVIMEGIVSDVDLNLFQNDYVYVKLRVEISGTIM